MLKWSKLSTLAVDNVHLGTFYYLVNILHSFEKGKLFLSVGVFSVK